MKAPPLVSVLMLHTLLLLLLHQSGSSFALGQGLGQGASAPDSSSFRARRALTQSNGGCQYTIKSGDTLYALSQVYGTDVATLQALNPGVVPTALQVGQLINVPCTGGGPAAGGAPQPPPSSSGEVLYSGSGDGTYYFDVRGNYCPQDPNGYPENDGYPACASFDPSGSTYQTLAQLGSNNVVAIDRDVLSGNRAGLCGRKILVFKDGAPVAAPDGGDFFVWDGCEACVGGGRIDFSVSGLQSAERDACTLGVVPGISWQMVDEVVKPFVP